RTGLFEGRSLKLVLGQGGGSLRFLPPPTHSLSGRVGLPPDTGLQRSKRRSPYVAYHIVLRRGVRLQPSQDFLPGAERDLPIRNLGSSRHPSRSPPDIALSVVTLSWWIVSAS